MHAIRPFILGLLAVSTLSAFPHQSRPEQTTSSPPSLIPAWEIQAGGTDASLRGISVVDELTAWASGSKGTVLRTTDGGKTWPAKPVPAAVNIDFRDIEALDARTAIIMGIGRPAKIFRTTDGGGSWVEVYGNDRPGIFLDAMAFADADNGWAAGDPLDGRFFLLRTSDGGRTWREPPEQNRPAALEGEGLFAASGTCLEVRGGGDIRFCTGGPASRLFHSRDDGRTWSIRDSPLLSGQPSYGTFSLSFLDDTLGLIVGGDYRNEPAAVKNAAWTSDGGKTWTLVESKPPAGFRESIAFVPGTAPVMAVSVGPSGSDYSLDRGASWTPLSGPSGFHALGFARSGKAGWAVGMGGLIAKLRLPGGSAESRKH